MEQGLALLDGLTVLTSSGSCRPCKKRRTGKDALNRALPQRHVSFVDGDLEKLFWPHHRLNGCRALARYATPWAMAVSDRWPNPRITPVRTGW